MKLVPKSWMPNCSMKRIIVHWTAGAHKASSLDLAHYHILIEDDGKLFKGTHSILDNASTGDNRYAAHTFRLNTGSIGVSACGMAEATEKPFNAGSFPMSETQWNIIAQVVAEFCEEYEIAVTPQTVLGHGEVKANFQIPQGGKSDPMVLPWDTTGPIREVVRSGCFSKHRNAAYCRLRFMGPEALTISSSVRSVGGRLGGGP